ncbi:DNA methyltransferase [Tissierella creatinophila]|uniref:Methyltransferase n=1 Tax=Tissierella creatinophila DSM 6911 TaxID=1123403 RepID=A0A1U7M6D9_TISCR|nr:DNA methyltransferase [Tissierella creatinophila]OLS02894.1 modification methylase DpnIIB [Tissierella creatinophila DSM 6911]
MKLELNNLYNMDCMEGMKLIPDKYFELAIIDPPYGIGESGGKNKTRSNKAIAKDYKDYHGNDRSAPAEKYFKELMRISQNQIIWGANHFISKIPFDSSCWIVWDKDNSGDFADCELAWTSFNTAVRKFKYRWNGMLQEDMKNKELRIHPNQKPVALYKWLLKTYAKKGDKIIDTHVGSASSLMACHDLGFSYMGFEIDKGYFETATDRLSEHQSQLNLLLDFN